jgi:hypothetical protein
VLLAGGRHTEAPAEEPAGCAGASILMLAPYLALHLEVDVLLGIIAALALDGLRIDVRHC